MSTALHVDDRGFESLYRLHRPHVFAYALATVRSVEDAEDVTQTAFLNAYCALNRGVQPRETRRWLIAITRNVCRDRFREAKRRPAEEPLGDWVGVAPPPAETPFEIAEVSRELGKLNPRHRSILMMREFEGRSYAEISVEMGVTEAAVQALLVRARRALREQLELPMTCEQARRAAVRDLNGRALLAERKALNKHLRRCNDCAVFVGRRPRNVVRAMLLLPFLPFRRLGLLVGTSGGPAAGTSTGAAAGVAAKIAVLTAAGTAAVGVTADRLGSEPPPAPARPAAPAVHRHATVPKPVVFSPVSRPAPPASVHGIAPVPARPVSAPKSAPAAAALPAHAASVAPASTPPPAAAPAAPEPPASEPAPSAPAPPASDPPLPAASDPAPAGDAPAASSGPAPAPAAAPTVDPAAPAPAAQTAPAEDPAQAAAPPAQAAAPPVQEAAPPPPAPGQANPAPQPPPPAAGPDQAGSPGQGRAVGQGGIPPGQAKKASTPAGLQGR